MKIIVIGDKSRYQFLRKLTENPSLTSESLGRKKVVVTGNRQTESETIFFSPCLPLYTELEFPSENDINNENIIITRKDKLIIFIEKMTAQIRKAQESDAEKFEILKRYRNKALSCEIIVLVNNIEGMTSDISTKEDEVQEILRICREEGFIARKYILGELLDFLIYYDFVENNSKKEFESKFRNLREEIQNNFSVDYEMEMDLSGFYDRYIEDPNYFENFFRYTRHISNLVKSSTQKMYAALLQNQNKEFVKICEQLYEERMRMVAFWDMEKDKEILYRKIVGAYNEKFRKMPVISFKGSESDYEIWYSKNMNTIFEIKDKAKTFFQKDVCELMKEYILHRLSRVEDVLNGKIN